MPSIDKNKAQATWLSDQAILALIIVCLTALLGFLISEVQNKIGWPSLVTALVFVGTLFGLVLWLVQRPILQMLADLPSLIRNSRQGSAPWLSDTHQLMEYELESGSREIWVLSSDLLDDSQGGPFQAVVERKLKKRTKYVYFVPDDPVIRVRIETIFAHHGNSPLLRVIYLPESFFFLVPQLDIIVYDPLATKPDHRSAFMGIPALGEDNHHHARMSTEFMDKLIGILLPCYKRDTEVRQLALPEAVLQEPLGPTGVPSKFNQN